MNPAPQPGTAPHPPDQLSAAARTAARLAEILDQLITQAGQEGLEARQMAERLRFLEAQQQRASVWHEQLHRAVGQSLSPQDVQATAETVEALVQKPTDLLIMVRISEQAAQLAAMVRSYAELRRLIDIDPATS